MSRSVKKGPFAAPELLKRVDEMNKAGEKKVVKTWSRSSTIFPSFTTKWNLSMMVPLWDRGRAE